MTRRIATAVVVAAVLGLIAAGLALLASPAPAGGTSPCAGHPCAVVLGEDGH